MNRWIVSIVGLSLCFGSLMACSPSVGGPEETTQDAGAESSLERVSETQPEQQEQPDAGEQMPEPEPTEAPAEDDPDVSEPAPEVEPEPTPEPAPEPTPTRCNTGEACNALLDKDGLCPGDCIPQVNKATCRGTVVNGLCMRQNRRENKTQTTRSGLRFDPKQIPSQVRQGESGTFLLEVTNTTAQSKTVNLTYQARPQWLLENASLEGQITFAANETKTLTLKMKGLKADIFEVGGLADGRVVDIQIDGSPYTVYSTVSYPAQGNVACGTNYFPAQYCSGTDCTQRRTRYSQAMCCDKVFYPGANCCTNTDCREGSCIDGRCTSEQLIGLASSVHSGHERVLIVLSDQLDIPQDASKLCTNRYAEFKEKLKLDLIEAYLRKASQKYTKRDGVTYQWVVLAGYYTKDFNPSGPRDLRSMHTALETYMLQKKCIKNAHEFDKKILITGMMDITPFTGKAINGGMMGLKSINHYLMVHEMLHTYGANDLYLDLGGRFQYLFDLMGNNLGSYGEPEFGVSWGEVRWSDVNRDGVIDLFEYPRYPDAIIITKTDALLSQKDTVEITVKLATTEKGVTKRLLLRNFEIELPDYNNVKRTMFTSNPTTVFHSKEVDLAAIRKQGSIKVRVRATIHYTAPDFSRKTVQLDEVKTIPVKTN